MSIKNKLEKYRKSRISMLKEIIVYFTHHSLDLKELQPFTEQMRQRELIVTVCNSFVDTEYWTQTNKDSCLLITDEAHEMWELPIVGYGLDYQGAPFIIGQIEGITPQYFFMVYARYYKIPLKIIETERLYIREMSMQDMDALFELYDTLKDCPYIDTLYERAKEEEFSFHYIQNMYRFFQYGLWLVFLKETGKLIGRAGIENRLIDGNQCQEIGYLIGKPWQQQGFAYEACSAIVDYAKEELDIERLFLCTHKKNNPSAQLAKKLGASLYAGDVDGMDIYEIFTDQKRNE
jgi:RimJ/RimL family protein N-acetyltransferase